MSERNDFWSTLPGVLTAVAAIITAVGGLVTVLYTTGVLGPKPTSPVPGVGGMPFLVEPQNGATVSQPYVQPWPFKWDEPRAPGDVRQYHLRVFNLTAAYVLVDEKMKGTDYTISRQCSYIIDNNRLGWKWEVRAQLQDGTWGPWAASTFDVSPFNKVVYCQRCPDANNCQR